MSRSETAITAAGLRRTPLRLALLDLLCTEPDVAFSIPEIISKLNAQGLQPNKTTLYREMPSLIEAGLIEELNGDTRALRYKAACGVPHHHHHAVCSLCNRHVAVDLPRLEIALHAAEVAVRAKTGFSVSEHNLSFAGVCSACSNNQQESHT